MTIIQKGEPMNDLISRQAAIDEAEEWIEIAYCERVRQRERDAIRHVIKGIKKLPSVQPEDCDTCKHGYFGDDQCERCRVRYPSHYERRNDGEIIPE